MKYLAQAFTGGFDSRHVTAQQMVEGIRNVDDLLRVEGVILHWPFKERFDGLGFGGVFLNKICMGARVIGIELGKMNVKEWLSLGGVVALKIETRSDSTTERVCLTRSSEGLI